MDEITTSGFVNPENNGTFPIAEFPISDEVKKALLAWEDANRVKSFSERHSELGKMVKCHVCGHRHRAIIQCEQRFAKDENGFPRTGANIPGQYPNQTLRGALGVQYNVTGKRMLPHRSHKLLQLVQLTQDMFPAEQPFWPEPKDAMHRARTLAGRLLRKRRAAATRAERIRQHISRHINRGLLNGAVR